ncbi:MAG: hypothetical protein Q9191_003041 [Dirinaria sp. TL-2023a]
MSAPLRAILNDRDVSPNRGAPSSQPTPSDPTSENTNSHSSFPASLPPIATSSSSPSSSSSDIAKSNRPSAIPISLPTNVLQKRRRLSSSTPPATPSSPFKRLCLTRSPSLLPAQPPPSPEDPVEPFDIFTALLQHPELILEFTRYMDLEDLISLYAISRDFHFLVHNRFTTLILLQAKHKAPESASVFVYRCYKSLCHHDPGGRVNEVREGELRWVPTFRWLRMIIFREQVVTEILALMAAEGHHMPAGTSLTLKKIWFTIDIPDNTRRVGFLHNVKFWRDEDLFLATEFILKLDMRLTHPVAGSGDTGMRRMLLGQRSLSTLWRVLKREEMQTQLDMLRMMVRWNYEPPFPTTESIMGIPSHQFGCLQWEGWAARGHFNKMLQIDELVMREGIRRGLNLHECWLDMMLDGYVDKENWTDVRWDKDVEIEVKFDGEESMEEDSEPEDWWESWAPEEGEAGEPVPHPQAAAESSHARAGGQADDDDELAWTDVDEDDEDEDMPDARAQ